MAQTLDARTLRFQDVHRLLDLHRLSTASADALLSLPDLGTGDLETLDRIGAVLEAHYDAGRISEGEIKVLVLAPLLWLAGYYRPEIQISLEEDIADIEIPDQELQIKGRMDLLATRLTTRHGEQGLIWILVLETKNSEAAALTGVPQLLTYLYRGLDHQNSVWGLATNGIEYQFVYLKKETRLQYQLLPLLTLLHEQDRGEVVRILRGIQDQDV